MRFTAMAGHEARTLILAIDFPAIPCRARVPHPQAGEAGQHL
jgi:hypothetical protein